MGVKSVKKIFVIITTLLAVAIIIGSIITVVFSQRQAQTFKIQQQQFVKKPIPTLFLHGFGGSANSEKFMVKQAEKRGVTKDIITAYVSKDGAVTFNGVLNMNEDVNEITVDKDGKPSRMNQPYQQLRVLKDIYKGKGIEVLNIYGDLKDGTHSDGRVSNSSSKSLKYLLGNSPKSYRESKYEGEPAQHSQLHENENVANELIDFLWKK